MVQRIGPEAGARAPPGSAVARPGHCFTASNYSENPLGAQEIADSWPFSLRSAARSARAGIEDAQNSRHSGLFPQRPRPFARSDDCAIKR